MNLNQQRRINDFEQLVNRYWADLQATSGLIDGHLDRGVGHEERSDAASANPDDEAVPEAV